MLHTMYVYRIYYKGHKHECDFIVLGLVTHRGIFNLSRYWKKRTYNDEEIINSLNVHFVFSIFFYYIY